MPKAGNYSSVGARAFSLFGMNVGKSGAMNTLTRLFSLTLICLGSFLAGCDQIENRLGLEDPAKKAARLEAEGKAVGGACRQSGRAIEDCYAIYVWVPKEAVFAGWREMDEYMRENNLDTVTPVLPPPPPPEANTRKKKKKTVPTDTDDDADTSEEANGEAAISSPATSNAVTLGAPPFFAPAPVPVSPPPAATSATPAPAAATTQPAQP
jgi:hypothetical protein